MPFKLEHRIGIQAPAAKIWETLSNLSGWSSWSGIYPAASGRLLIGEQLSVTEQMPGEPARPIRPTVVDWVPEAQIMWQDKTFGGLVRTTRYMEIEALTERGCIFSNGELFQGFAARYLPAGRRRALRRGFAAFGEAVKARVEAGSGSS
jgi:hypothetical protein